MMRVTCDLCDYQITQAAQGQSIGTMTHCDDMDFIDCAGAGHPPPLDTRPVPLPPTKFWS